MPDRRVVIVGGGASGSLLAMQLLARGAQVCVVEPASVLGLGVAYATSVPTHLLNVPAARMSAFPEDPQHFERWLAARYGSAYGPKSFVPRTLYGAYLDDTLERARDAAPDRFEHVQTRAIAIRETQTGIAVATAGGGSVRGDIAVLAIGNAAPTPWPGLDTLREAGAAVFQSAWDPGALIPHNPDETVLLLGTGLTAVDAVLGLQHNGHRGIIQMVSRRGLLPHEHRLFDTPPHVNPDAKTMKDLWGALRDVIRKAPERLDWRIAVDSVRGRTNELWQSMDMHSQRRFVRHALPFWNVHRHRMAPLVARNLAEMIACDQLRMIAGRTQSMVATSEGIEVAVRLRGSDAPLLLRVDRIINCSGPQHDITKIENPLVTDLLATGLMVPHELGIGSLVKEDGALVGTSGVSDRLYAIGPVRFGTLIETTAIPEIRAQAAQLAKVLTEVDSCVGL